MESTAAVAPPLPAGPPPGPPARVALLLGQDETQRRILSALFRALGWASLALAPEDLADHDTFAAVASQLEGVRVALIVHDALSTTQARDLFGVLKPRVSHALSVPARPFWDLHLSGRTLSEDEFEKFIEKFIIGHVEDRGPADEPEGAIVATVPAETAGGWEEWDSLPGPPPAAPAEMTEDVPEPVPAASASQPESAADTDEPRSEHPQPYDHPEFEDEERAAIQQEPPPLPQPDPDKARTLVVTSADGIEPRAVRWAWENRIPLGMLTLLGGREGEGKSSVAYERAARVTRGQLPGDLEGQSRGVIIVAAEDSWEHTIVPRLTAAGADLRRCYRVAVRIVEDSSAYEISLPEDLKALEELIRNLDVALVILDPLISRLNRRIDSHKDAEVRTALEPLASVADRTGATFLGVIHLNKSGSSDPLNAVMASKAFTAAARAVLMVLRDGEERLLCAPKSNLGPEQPSLSFRIEGATVGTDRESGKPITSAQVVWTGHSTKSARDVLESQARGGHSDSTRGRASKWLADRLAEGPVSSADIKAAAEQAGIPERTLERAANDLGVQRKRAGFPSRSVWDLPEPSGTGSDRGEP